MLFTVMLEHFDAVLVLDHQLHILLYNAVSLGITTSVPSPTPDPGNAIHFSHLVSTATKILCTLA